MRMTRAALRAQESLDTLTADQTPASMDSATAELPQTLIFEDSDKENSQSPVCSSETSELKEPGRLALRDITAENYPTLVSPVVSEATVEENNSKKVKKGKGAKGRKKKAASGKEQQVLVGATVENPFVEAVSEENSGIKDSRVASDESRDLECLRPIAVEASPEANEDAQVDVQSETEVVAAQATTEFVTESSNIAPRELPIVTADAVGPECLTESTKDVPETPQKSSELAAKTPKFDPEIHLSAKPEMQTQSEISEDSFVGSIKTRSPSKLSARLHPQQRTPKSTVETTVPCSVPKKSPSPRVEDSVAALDELEDALERVSKELPAIHQLIIDSPVKARGTTTKTATPLERTNTLTTSNLSSKKTTTPAPLRTVDSKLQTSREKLMTKSTVRERVKELESKPVSTVHRRATSVTLAKRMTETVPGVIRTSKHGATKSVSAVPSNVTKPAAVNNEPSISKDEPKVAKKRIVSSTLSTGKPAFVPAKSTKPVTKSTFVLPGEAIAAKLRAQREERTKREGEAAATKPQFKARPVPAKLARPSIMPRENKTSQARTKPRTEGSEENKENVAPFRTAQNIPPKPTATARSHVESTKANSSARRTTTIAPTVAVSSKRSTIAAPIHRVISSISAPVNKGKEVFDRHRVTIETETKEKRDKEEAAKRARAEAAERGRQASREWAEKQKRKLMEKAAATAKVEEVNVEVKAVS